MSVRAQCLIEFGRYLMADENSDPSIEADAGSLMVVEVASDIHFIAEWIKAQSSG